MPDDYEIHCVKISSVNKSTSIIGSTRGSSSLGSGSVGGNTDTYHELHITSDGKTYAFESENTTYPFDTGDEVVFLCVQNEDTSIYRVISFYNNTKGIRFIKSPTMGITKVLAVAFSLTIITALASDISMLTSLIVGLVSFVFVLDMTLKSISKCRNFERVTEVFESLSQSGGVEDIQSKLLDHPLFGDRAEVVGY